MQLLGLAKKPNRKMAEQAISAFKNLFTNGYMISNTNRPEEDKDKKLSVFTRNPVIINKRNACTDDELLQAH